MTLPPLSSHSISRRDFIKLCAALLVTVPLTRCRGGNPLDGEFEGRVLIIGAGAAGLTAGHLLGQRNVEFQIMEAAATYGGRIKRASGFVDFPIPLGGEWLHVAADELDTIVNDRDVEVTTQLKAYRSEDSAGFFDGELSIGPLGEYSDLKFVGATWLDFFDEYIVPTSASRIRFNTEIVSVDYSGDTIVLTDSSGSVHEADRVIVTAPLRVLQEEAIRFSPPLPADKRSALAEAYAWGGMKVFIEFSEQFYPTFLMFPDSETERGQRLYYDAAYGQNSSTNVLGLFSVGTAAEPYQAHTGDQLRDYIVAELDEVFDGAASRSYVRHIAQDWSKEPFIGQAYLFDNSDSRIPRELWEPIDNRVFFAGEAYTRHDDWGGVHDAARAARDAVARILS